MLSISPVFLIQKPLVRRDISWKSVRFDLLSPFEGTRRRSLFIAGHAVRQCFTQVHGSCRKMMTISTYRDTFKLASRHRSTILGLVMMYRGMSRSNPSAYLMVISISYKEIEKRNLK